MDELLEQLAAESGVPESLLDRAAAARAAAMGISTEDLVRQWAGVAGDAPPSPAAPAPQPEPAAPVEPVPEAAPSPADQPPGATAEVLEPTAPPPEAGEAEDEEEVVEEVPELLGGVPGWLAAAFALVPIVAVLYALSVPNGPDCGSSGQLRIDPVTGNAVNCDGTEYGSTEGQLLAVGQQIYDARCAACHGAGGGGGAGPALSGGAVLATFSSCTQHIEWVALGTNGWPDPTYGDNDSPVGGFGIMPGFGGTLTDDELAAVAAYERVAFGDEDRDMAIELCTSTEDVAALSE